MFTTQLDGELYCFSLHLCLCCLVEWEERKSLFLVPCLHSCHSVSLLLSRCGWYRSITIPAIISFEVSTCSTQMWVWPALTALGPFWVWWPACKLFFQVVGQAASLMCFHLSLQLQRSRTVTQFHFLTWSSAIAPTTPTPLLEFRRLSGVCVCVCVCGLPWLAAIMLTLFVYKLAKWPSIVSKGCECLLTFGTVLRWALWWTVLTTALSFGCDSADSEPALTVILL